MENAALLILLESVLGASNRTSRGNYAFHCPFCPTPHHKPKLEINCVTNAKNENPWHCWVCEAKGKTIRSLLKQAKAPASKLSELKLIIVPSKEEVKRDTTILALPKEFPEYIFGIMPEQIVVGDKLLVKTPYYKYDYRIYSSTIVYVSYPYLMFCVHTVHTYFLVMYFLGHVDFIVLMHFFI
jgi:hypothetical protein